MAEEDDGDATTTPLLFIVLLCTPQNPDQADVFLKLNDRFLNLMIDVKLFLMRWNWRSSSF